MNQAQPSDSSAHEPTRPSSQAGSTNLDRVRIWQSEQLLEGASEALIQHGPEVYRLRLTRNGKLILHK